jgi:serine/threonine-protein kinase
MSDAADFEQLSPEELRRIEVICMRFEAAWKARNPDDSEPRIDDYLHDVAEPVRPILQRELLALGMSYRARMSRGRKAIDRSAATLGPGDQSSDSSSHGEELKSGHPPGWPVIPGYEISQVLGQGGMGIVYKAQQQVPNRTVALKMLSSHAITGTGESQRFRTEVEATASLQHPNIVRVYEFGEVNCQLFYSMDYVDGPSLESRLADGPLGGKAAAGYLLPIAHAIQHAHEHGILHRDLKPSNILLDSHHRPHVTDFGLAKRLGLDSGPTCTGQILGTPSYMAPEQAAGSKELTQRTDVYGLGAVLYTMVTGRPPFQAESPLDTIIQVTEREPAPPRLLNPNIDRDLETICLKCLEKSPGDRYANAREVAADLERYLADEPIHARSVNLLDRVTRTLGRSFLDAEYHDWGTLLLYIGATILVCHSAVFVASWWDVPIWYRWITGAVQFVLIGLLFLRHRLGRLLPTSASERQLWSIWIGYLVAFATIAVISLQTADRRVFERLLAGLPPGSQLSLYPYSSVLAGLAFFVMGSHYWGGCYVIGLAFCVLAVLMPFDLAVAPLEFAVLWSVSLFTIGIRLRRLAAKGRKRVARSESSTGVANG